MRGPLFQRKTGSYRRTLFVPETLSASIIRSTKLTAALVVIAFTGCDSHTNGVARQPVVLFTTVPFAEAAGPDQLRTVKGKVIGAQPGQLIVLYAGDTNTWWVQPFADRPFTKVQADSSWSNSTHPGAQYAALLVSADFRPPPTTHTLPKEGVLAFAIAKGAPHAWQTWWFYTLCALAGVLAIVGIHAMRLRYVRKSLQVRFEERLAERVRVAQELHDTLLQGVISASMQLHLVVDDLPEQSPVQAQLSRVLQIMHRVVDEGRNTLRGLRSSIEKETDLQDAFSRIPVELGTPAADFRLIVEGNSMPLRAVVRDDVYRIGREAVVNAFRHSGARNVDLHMVYGSDQLRIVVRDNGCGIDPQILKSGRDGHWGMSGMRERAERIGGKLRVFSRSGNGTEVELRVPFEIAFESHRAGSASR